MALLFPALSVLALALAGFASTRALAYGDSSSYGNDAPGEAFKVVQYLDLAKDQSLVVVGGGRDSGVMPGSVFTVYRASKAAPRQAGDQEGTLWIETGRMKAVEVQDDYTVARIEENGSNLSRAFFAKFPGVMAGDVAVIKRVTIARRPVVTPTVSLSYFDIFEDPKATPATFELRRDGLAQLKAAAQAFAAARLTVLMVEGHTDHNGVASANQVESYQRALTVRQFLIDELGFDPDRIVAVGYGESEPLETSLVPGYVETNRRIVLKAVPMPRAASR